MNQELLDNLENPEKLEEFYRSNKSEFHKQFFEIVDDIPKNDLIRFWSIRLNFDLQSKPKEPKIAKFDIYVVVAIGLLCGFSIKIPQIFHLNEELFYARNTTLIVFGGLMLFSIWLNKIYSLIKLLPYLLIFTASIVYVNLLPNLDKSSTHILILFHLPIVLWCIFGILFNNLKYNDIQKRIEFLKFNGDLIILTGLILITGAILTAFTLLIFSVINIRIEEFYFKNIVTTGLVSAPVVATFIFKNYPAISSKLAPIISNIFSPLFLITLTVYLAVFPFSKNELFTNRDLLIVFDVMLIGVMCIIIFSVSETSNSKKEKFNEFVIFALAIVTILVDLIALSAILYRIKEFGISPNRLAILGLNIVSLINLIQIAYDLFRINFKGFNISIVEQRIAKYLPIYLLWALVVIIIFPILFGLQ